MDWVKELFQNPFFVAGVSGGAIAQILKFFIYAIVNKEIDFKRIYGDGGMPSGHSAVVVSLMVLTGLRIGVNSFEFAIASILALVVCRDAMGVRWETGKQAVLLKELVKAFESLSDDELPSVRLKEFVGHTPLQVLFGILLGIANACVMHFWVFPVAT